MGKVIGIDISKASFDFAFNHEGKWHCFKLDNNQSGFKKFIAQLEQEDHCVMEASGPYYLPLALFLSEHSIKVSVVNPLVIKRFAQMRLVRAKTDAKDARVIAEYGISEQPKAWKAEEKIAIKMRQIMSALDNINKQMTMTNNQFEAFKSTGILDPQVKKSLKSILKHLKLQKAKLEEQIEKYILEHYKETEELLRSIPGIGKKAAIILILLTDNFRKFDHYKKLIAYVGFSPRVYQSGKSIKGKGHICKMGQNDARKILYMCAWSAKRYNKSCMDLYQRLKSAGKPEKVIKVAIANKLLKQAFAIVNSKQKYDENYGSNICI